MSITVVHHLQFSYKKTRVFWVYLQGSRTFFLQYNHVTYRGHASAELFIDHRIKLEGEIVRVLHAIQNQCFLSDEENETFQKTTICYLSNK